MCLDIVEKIYNPQLEEIWGGFKIFRRKNKRLVGDIYAPHLERPIHQWLNEKGYRPVDCFLHTIKTDHLIGWYIFENIEKARMWCVNIDNVIFKVKGRGIRSKGIQNLYAHIGGPAHDASTFVSEELFIMHEVLGGWEYD